jgi:hypothetical protein
MTNERRNSLLAFGVIAAVAAFAFTWMTVYVDPASSGPSALLLALSSPGFGMPLRPSNGSVKLIVSIPVWAVIVLAASSNAIQIVAQTRAFDVPRIAMWIVSLLAAAYVAIPAAVGLMSGRISLDMGWFLGMLSVSIAVYCLASDPNEKIVNHDLSPP